MDESSRARGLATLDFAAGDHSVVVVHGLWMPGAETKLLCRRLAAFGLAAHIFRYRTVGHGLDENARRLAGFVDATPGKAIHLVGYSLGGVISVLMAQTRADARIGRVVCLGAPLNGSATAEALLRIPGGRRLLGRSIIELTERGGVGAWSGVTELGIVAGSVGVGAGRLFMALRGPNDGTVAVSETRLAGASDHIVCRVSHTSMLFSKGVAEKVGRFLRHGAFRPQGPEPVI
jgi:pimeloyl-ACP methyl ester carboxylesterase